MKTAFWSYGFRPFFSLAALAAVATLVVLLVGLWRGAWPADVLPLARWHGHEMLFGFAGAAIAGFLLTAVPTWTGTPAISGTPLACLAALWLAGRFVMHPAVGVGGTALVLVDALFLPAIGLVIGIALVRARNYRNFAFMAILALFTIADLVFLAAQLGWMDQPPFDPLRLVANLIQLMVALIGGRIVPLFTCNALLERGVKVDVKPQPSLDRATMAALAAIVAVDVVAPDSAAAGALAALGALALAARLVRWHGLRTLRMPIVWILHAGYAWLVVALALKAAWLLGGVAWAAYWLHALTAGAFGTMILGVMTRVALGHSGRRLVVSPAITLAYLLVIVGAALRVFGPVIAPQLYTQWLVVGGVGWASAFVIFLAVYLPILIAPRADAR